MATSSENFGLPDFNLIDSESMLSIPKGDIVGKLLKVKL